MASTPIVAVDINWSHLTRLLSFHWDISDEMKPFDSPAVISSELRREKKVCHEFHAVTYSDLFMYCLKFFQRSTIINQNLFRFIGKCQTVISFLLSQFFFQVIVKTAIYYKLYTLSTRTEIKWFWFISKMLKVP